MDVVDVVFKLAARQGLSEVERRFGQQEASARTRSNTTS